MIDKNRGSIYLNQGNHAVYKQNLFEILIIYLNQN
jgi:hypothetical protein